MFIFSQKSWGVCVVVWISISVPILIVIWLTVFILWVNLKGAVEVCKNSDILISSTEKPLYGSSSVPTNSSLSSLLSLTKPIPFTRNDLFDYIEWKWCLCLLIHCNRSGHLLFPPFDRSTFPSTSHSSYRSQTLSSTWQCHWTTVILHGCSLPVQQPWDKSHSVVGSDFLLTWGDVTREGISYK